MSMCLSVSLHRCLSAHASSSFLTLRRTFVLAFVLPYKTNQSLKGLKLLSEISSRLLMQAVSIAQWREEIKLFMEKTGDGRDSLFFLRPSLSEVLRPPFYLETHSMTCTYKDLEINTIDLPAVNIKSISFILAINFLFSHIIYSCQTGFHCFLMFSFKHPV